jgi:CBS domain containing-hemolysin-like protein
VANIVEQSTRDGMLTDTSGTLTAAFEFTAKTVTDVEVPISQLVLLPQPATPPEIQRAVAEHGYSRVHPH